MALSKEFVDSIRPKIKGKSDKYSWKLWKFLNTKMFGKKRFHEDGFYMADFGSGPAVYVGWLDPDGCIIGARLSRLCTVATGNCTFYHEGSDSRIPIEDITEKFVSEYLEKGRCIIHGDYADHEWVLSEDGKSRFCEYCGEKNILKPVEANKWFKV